MSRGTTFEKCFLPESVSRVGGGLWMVISSTFMGGSRAKGAWPWASSRMVIPNDQISANELYLGRPKVPGSRAAARGCRIVRMSVGAGLRECIRRAGLLRWNEQDPRR